MRHQARKMVLDAIDGTPLEPLARKVYGRLVPSKGNLYDKQTFELMRKHLGRDANCVDVGAYRGEILHQMLKISPKGKHYAFEPTPDNYRYTAKKYKKARVYNLAVSDKPGTTTFHHVVGRAARSGLKRVEYPDKDQTVEKIKVKLDKLDNIIPKGVPIHFIKIDVEGAELGVLKGASNLIKKHSPIIVFEHELDKARHYGTEPEHIYDLLVNELGMKIFLMADYFQGKSSLSKSRFRDTVRNNSDFYFMATA